MSVVAVLVEVAVAVWGQVVCGWYLVAVVGIEGVGACNPPRRPRWLPCAHSASSESTGRTVSQTLGGFAGVSRSTNASHMFSPHPQAPTPAPYYGGASMSHISALSSTDGTGSPRRLSHRSVHV